MNKKTTQPHKSFLLPPPRLLLKLFGIDKPEKMLYDLLKKFSPGQSFSMDMKTFKSALGGARQPQQKTIDKLISAIPALTDNEQFMSYLYRSEDIDMSISEWESIINAFQPSAENDFPFFRRKLLEIVETEKEILTEAKNVTKLNEVSSIFANHKFIKQFLSESESQKLVSLSVKQEELELIMGRLGFKMILFCAAYLDADYSYDFKETTNEEGLRRGKVSMFRGVFPTFDKGKYINPVDNLFIKWKTNFGLKHYAQIEKLISANGYDDETVRKETQRTKLKQWRKCEKIAKNEEILNIVRGLLPEEEMNETDEFRILLIYKLAVFCSKYLDHLLSIKNGAGHLFKMDSEVVAWMHENYDKFFDEAYADVEKFYESA